MPARMTLPADTRAATEKNGASAFAKLVRDALARTAGIRVARFFAVVTTTFAIVAIALAAGRFGADATSLSIAAYSAGTLTWLSGGIATLALARTPHDTLLGESIGILAASRGFNRRRRLRAEARASIRLLAETVALPITVIALFVLTIVAGGGIAAPLRTLVGTVVFGVIASVLLALMATTCRQWGGPRGRGWLLTVVTLPWLLCEWVLPSRAASYGSIPGLLGRLWEALAAVRT